MNNITFCVTRRWPGSAVRIIVVIIVFVVTTRWIPGDTIPVGLGTALGAWLAGAPGQRPALATGGS